MDEDAFNLSIRKFLKHFGVTAQREIESAIRKAIDDGRLRGDEGVPVRATLVVDGILREFQIEGTLRLSASPDAALGQGAHLLPEIQGDSISSLFYLRKTRKDAIQPAAFAPLNQTLKTASRK